MMGARPIVEVMAERFAQRGQPVANDAANVWYYTVGKPGPR
jgi:pyruvate/2-oxoglutarate/acetoin dehydrogenase E1 component